MSDKLQTLVKNMNKNELKKSKKNNKEIKKQYSLQDLLNTIRILEENIKKNNKVASCTICMEEIPYDEVVTTRCKHQFCQECFWTWTKKNNSCPNCRGELMDKDRKAELELEYLLERRKEIRDSIEEIYEEYDEVKFKYRRKVSNLHAIQKKICERDIELQILNDEVESMSDLHDEIITYKKNPKKAMKMMDKRIKKLGKQIKIKQKENKKNMLCELTMGPLYGIDYTYPDEEEFDDFSDAFHIFDTEETGEYCTATKCKCEACSNKHVSKISCVVIEEVRRLWRRENGWDSDIYDDYETESENETVLLDNITIRDVTPLTTSRMVSTIGGESTEEEVDSDMEVDSDYSSMPELEEGEIYEGNEWTVTHELIEEAENYADLMMDDDDL